MQVAKGTGLYLALNLLIFPGVTDREAEVERLSAPWCAGSGPTRCRPGRSPWTRTSTGRSPGSAAGGGRRWASRRCLRALREARPGLVIGNFARGLLGAGEGGVSEVEATLELQKDLARHLRAGHPWVFRKAIEQAPRGLAAGAIVDVVEDGRFVARGYLDPHSAITVRILTREPAEAVDAAFWRGRVRRALALRSELVRGTTGYRLVHGENDGLPGVVADRYGDFAVLKLYSAGLTPHRAHIVEALRQEVQGLAGVFGRDEVPRDEERTTPTPQGRVLWGAEPPERIEIDEHGMKLLVDVRRGQKTGLFLDQRENRRLVRELSAGRGDALNLFGYTGGFSVAAALGGARHVVTIDVDQRRHRAGPGELPGERPRPGRPRLRLRGRLRDPAPLQGAGAAGSTSWCATRRPSPSRRRRSRGRWRATPRSTAPPCTCSRPGACSSPPAAARGSRPSSSTTP